MKRRIQNLLRRVLGFDQLAPCAVCGFVTERRPNEPVYCCRLCEGAGRRLAEWAGAQ